MSSIRRAVSTLGVVVIVVTMSMSGFSAQAIDPVEDWRQSKIVFDSMRDGNFEIYVMNADGSDQQRLTNWDRGDQFPAWTPDGKRISFTSWGREDGLRAAVFTMEPDGSHVTRISKGIGRQSEPMFPGALALGGVWSPDGQRILFDSPRDGNGEIFVMDADGSNVQRLTHTPGIGKVSEDADWSPDGNWIAFASDRDGNGAALGQVGNYRMYVMSADGSNLRRLTDMPGGRPRWSPDGRRIVFTSPGDRRADNPVEVVEIYTMDADGSDVRRLTYTTDAGESSSDARWSPDGTKIAFLSGSDTKIRDGDKSRFTQWMDSREIYVMDADGSNVQRLTFNDAYDGHLDWEPTPR